MSISNKIQNKNENHTTKALSKPPTTEESKQFVRDSMHAGCDPEYLFREISGVLQKLKDGSKKGKDEAKKYLQEQSDQFVMALGLENHYHLRHSVSKKYAPLVLNVVQQIEKDYKCTTALEKATAELVALAHVQVINDQKRLNDFLNCVEEVDDASTRCGAFFSKQADRSYRNFLSMMTALRQLKQPQLEVNIKTHNAFVAQNQQINDNRNYHENIQPK